MKSGNLAQPRRRISIHCMHVGMGTFDRSKLNDFLPVEGRTIRRPNKLGLAVSRLRLGRTTAGVAAAGTRGAAADQVCERLVEVNAAIATESADLLRLGEGVGDVARLGRRARLQDKSGRTSNHGSTE